MAGEEIFAERGTGLVQKYFDGDAKASISFFAPITAEGERLPLGVIAKGKSNRCHKQFGRQDAHCFDI
jgi:hypothetical protein